MHILHHTTTTLKHPGVDAKCASLSQTLFLLMPVLPQTFLAFVSSHLMPLTLLSTWHLIVLYKINDLLHVTLDLVYKCLGRFKCRNIVLRYYNSCIL